MRKIIASLAAVILTAGIAIADETRLSLGYQLHNVKYEVDGVGDVDSKDKRWSLLVEGDEADFYYWLNIARGSEKASEGGASLEADYRIHQAFLGWHGLDLGGIGIGPAILHQKANIDDVTVNLNGQSATLDLDLAGDATFAGVLMRTENDQLDFTTAVGIDAGSDGWKSGTALLIGADIHISEPMTLTGTWERLDGEFENNGGDIGSNAFTFGGRYQITDTVFAEGTLGLIKEEYDSYDRSSRFLHIGVGARF